LEISLRRLKSVGLGEPGGGGGGGLPLFTDLPRRVLLGNPLSRDGRTSIEFYVYRSRFWGRMYSRRGKDVQGAS
jgi:hypothetical protein